MDKNEQMEIEQQKAVKDTLERINKITTRDFYISKCPEDTYQRFVAFCSRETLNYYALGLKYLLDFAETNAKDAVFFQRLLAMEERIIALEEKLAVAEQKPVEAKVKTFGGKRT